MADPGLTEEHWRILRSRNAERQELLVKEGFNTDFDPVVCQTWLEHILAAVAGDEGVLACRIATQERIAAMLDQIEENASRARLLQGVPRAG